MKDHFATIELAGMPGMPGDERNVRARAKRESWPRRKRSGRGGGWDYPLSCLPSETQAALVLRHRLTPPPSLGLGGDGGGAPANDDSKRSHLWAVFDRKPQKQKDVAARRLRLVASIEDLQAQGWAKLKAIAAVAKQSDISVGSIRGWLALLDGLDRSDRLPALAPRWSGRATTAGCSIEAWDYFKTDYLSLERACASASYDRLLRIAPAQGWQVPSLRTLMRRLEREVHPATVALKRHGRDAAKRHYPAQRRDRSVFTALEAVNADGHKFDVFVKWDDGTISRPIGLFWQDLHSGKILTWRVGRSESAELVRLSFADLVEQYGIPRQAWFDNGRGFASKWNTGGIGNRYRFKIREEDPDGVFKLLGVTIHWTKPYSGQSKPIERAFRDLCAEYVAKHPACEDAYVGNRPDAKPESYGKAAVPIAKFLEILAAEVAAHNAREGRRSDVCAGRSFDAVFDESYAAAAIGKATDEQRRLLLLAAEGITADRETGAIRLYGNTYWSDTPALARAAGGKVIVRFDPQRLTSPVHVYALDGRYLATAEMIERAGFDNVDKAREHNRDRASWIKAKREQASAEVRMSRREAAELLPKAPAAAQPEPKIVRPLFGRVGTGAPKGADIMSKEEADRRFHDYVEAERKRKGIDR